jgi:hypothetical protein
MNKREMAQGLVELWELYLRKSWPRSFQPTMTDFVEWLQDSFLTNEPEVKENRTSPYNGAEFDPEGFRVMPYRDEAVNASKKLRLVSPNRREASQPLTRSESKNCTRKVTQRPAFGRCSSWTYRSPRSTQLPRRSKVEAYDT